MRYGVDIAVRRADDLDKLMVEDAATRVARGDTPSVLDIGCGAGGQAKRLAAVGAQVTAIDVSDYSAEFAAHTVLGADKQSGTVTFIEADIVRWLQNTPADKFDLVCCQRTLHYLQYAQAKYMLSELQKRTNGSLYLSVTGATSAIAGSYPLLGTLIAKRFATLAAPAQETFSISAPLCIYHKEEVLTLLSDTGWDIKYYRVSDFGNIKVIATAT